MTDPYQVLGISPNATDEEVKRAYKEMSKKYHPDAYIDNPLSDLAEDKFKEVQDAYTQIMNQRAGGGNGYRGGYNGGFTQGGQSGQGYQNGQYSGQGYQNGQYNRQSYQNYGSGYGRNPNSYYGGGGCSTGNICCDLWCADSLCECMGGDLCSCI